jgi:hypothetical protein
MGWRERGHQMGVESSMWILQSSNIISILKGSTPNASVRQKAFFLLIKDINLWNTAYKKLSPHLGLKNSDYEETVCSTLIKILKTLKNDFKFHFRAKKARRALMFALLLLSIILQAKFRHIYIVGDHCSALSAFLCPICNQKNN